MPHPFTWNITAPNPAVDRVKDFPTVTFYHGDKTTLRDILPLTDKGSGSTLGWRTQQYGNVVYMMWNASSADGVTFNRDDTGIRAFAFRWNTDGTVECLQATAAANPITWTSRLFMKDAGVAIGASMAPSAAGAALHARTEVAGSRASDFSYAANDVLGWIVRLYKSRGTHAAPTSVLSGDQLGQYMFGGQAGGGLFDAASVSGTAAEAWSGTVAGTHLDFLATRIGGQVLRLRYRILGTVGSSHEWWNADGTLIMALDHASAAGDTQMQLARDGTTLSRVSLGALDSGGAGFKLLRVPN